MGTADLSTSLENFFDTRKDRSGVETFKSNVLGGGRTSLDLAAGRLAFLNRVWKTTSNESRARDSVIVAGPTGEPMELPPSLEDDGLDLWWPNLIRICGGNIVVASEGSTLIDGIPPQLNVLSSEDPSSQMRKINVRLKDLPPGCAYKIVHIEPCADPQWAFVVASASTEECTNLYGGAVSLEHQGDATLSPIPPERKIWNSQTPVSERTCQGPGGDILFTAGSTLRRIGADGRPVSERRYPDDVQGPVTSLKYLPEKGLVVVAHKPEFEVQTQISSLRWSRGGLEVVGTVPLSLEGRTSADVMPPITPQLFHLGGGRMLALQDLRQLNNGDRSTRATVLDFPYARGSVDVSTFIARDMDPYSRVLAGPSANGPVVVHVANNPCWEEHSTISRATF